MTDTSPTDPLVSLKKSEWDAYRLYVAGLEGKVSAYENAATKHVESVIPSPGATREEGYLSASQSVEVSQPKMSAGHVALYTIGWVFFVLQMIPPAVTGIGLGMALLVGPGEAGKVSGGLVLLGLAIVFFLVILIQVRLWTRRRPLGVLLFGLLAPWPFWLPSLLMFL